MKRSTLAYWLATGSFAAAMTGSGLAMLTRQAPLVATFEHLDLPAYLLALIGTMKLAGVAAVLAPGLPRLKEWAYAGFVINLGGAVYVHLAAGDGLSTAVGPTVLAALALTSWALRPASRRFEAKETATRADRLPPGHAPTPAE